MKKKENLNITFTFQNDISEELEDSLWFQLFELLEIWQKQITGEVILK